MRDFSFFLFLALLCAGGPRSAFAKSVDNAPSGISPTTMKLGALLAAHDASVGVYPAAMLKTAHEQWKYTEAGTSGTETLFRAGTDYHSSISYGPFSEQYGQRAGKRWHQDANGLTTDAQGSEERSFYTARVLEDAADPKNDAKVLGQVAAPSAAYVVEVKVSGSKHPEWIFYDKASFLITRVEGIVNNRRLISTYDTFVTTNGVAQATHIHDTDGRSYLDDDWTRTSFEAGTAVSLSEFSPPQDRRSLIVSAGQGDLPVKFVAGAVIVRVTIKGQGFDFELDSSSSGMHINRQTALDLHLPTYGQPLSLGGNDLDYTTTVDDLQVGPIHLPNVVMETRDLHYHRGSDTEVVGRLGFDFLRDQVLVIDYVNAELTTMNTRDFDNTSPQVGVMQLPVTLDDGIPFVAVGIGSTAARRFIFDNTSRVTMIFGGFTVAHPDDVKDMGKGRQMMKPVVERDDAGDSYEFGISEVPHFTLGSTDFTHSVVLTTTIPIEYDGEQVDGLLGRDIIHYYDVVFDYPHKRILLSPNKLFKDTFKPVAVPSPAASAKP
ncbi:MAG: hypothetical protein NVS9B12_04650 [Vulcanimicrobiaceae bacterium]